MISLLENRTRFLSIALIALALSFGGTMSIAHAQSSANDVQTETTQVTPTGEGAETPVDYQADSSDEAYNGIMIKIMSLFAWLVGVSAITLDNVVYYTVVHMGNFVNGLSAIGVTWRVLRDIGNIILIFSFLAIGISIILNTERFGYGKKLLPTLLIVAVFLNFSLFISEAIIDTGNLFATQFYTQINGGDAAGTKSFDPGSLRVQNEGISNAVMAQLGLQTIYSDALDPNNEIFKADHPWFIGFMGIILFLILAFVFFSLAFVLLARFVILLYLIIIAPVGFAGLAIPRLSKYAKQWWEMLVDQTLVAPVLLLMLYVALRIITDGLFLTSFGIGGTDAATGAYTGFINNNLDGFAGVLVSFLVAMGLLLAVTIFAKKLSAFGAGWATEWGGRLSFGLAGAAGRRTLGRLSAAGARGVRQTRFGRTEAGRYLAGGLDKGAKASFDVRGITSFGGLKGLGVEAGSPTKGGYAQTQKAATEGRTKYAKSLKLTGGERAAKEKIEADLKELEERRDADLATAATKADRDRIRETFNRDKEAIEKQTINVKGLGGVSHESIVGRALGAKQVSGLGNLKQAPQAGYAESLSSRTPDVLSLGTYHLTAGPYADKAAVDEIKKGLKKSKDEKAIDAFKEIFGESKGGESKEEKT